MYSNNTNNGGPATFSLPSDYNRSGVGEPTKRPLKKKNAAQSFQPTAAVLTVAVLLCVLSCSLTVALSYKWYADADRQINVLLAVVEDVTRDLNKLTGIIRDEVVAKRLPNNSGGSSSSSTAKTNNADYDDTDDDYAMMDRFMGRDLSLNNWPTKTFRGPTTQEAAGSGDEELGETSENRRRRSAEIDAKSAAVKNQPNGSNYDKTTVELLQDDANEANTVKTNRRRSKKLQPKKKPVEDSSVSYELRESQNVVAAHFASDKSKYNTITHPNYLGNGRLKHPDGEFKDWTYVLDADTNSANYFQMKNGKVDVSKPGIYYVYAQIYYSDQHDINGYYIMKNDEKVFGCTTTRYQDNQSDSCYTGGLINLNSKDVISIKGLYSERYIFLDSVSSFFGLFLVSSKDGKR